MSSTPGTAGSTGGGLERVRQEYEDTQETKPGLKTSEFLSSIIPSVGILIAALVDDNFGAEEAWRLVAFLSVGYMISRGLAKSGIGRGRSRA